MNRAELIAAVASKLGISKASAAKIVQSILHSITTALKAGREVRLAGFGTFRVARRPARSGRNPRTGEAVKIASFSKPMFRATGKLRYAIQGDGDDTDNPGPSIDTDNPGPSRRKRRG